MYSTGRDLQSKKRAQRSMALISSRIASKNISVVVYCGFDFAEFFAFDRDRCNY
jgi:hypothetical protein